MDQNHSGVDKEVVSCCKMLTAPSGKRWLLLLLLPSNVLMGDWEETTNYHECLFIHISLQGADPFCVKLSDLGQMMLPSREAARRSYEGTNFFSEWDGKDIYDKPVVRARTMTKVHTIMLMKTI
ncbi:hypothetical protein S83_067423 [Arachis hypogaea]